MKSYKTTWADSRHGGGWMCPYCVDKHGHTLATHNRAMFLLPRATSQSADGTLVRRQTPGELGEAALPRL